METVSREPFGNSASQGEEARSLHLVALRVFEASDVLAFCVTDNPVWCVVHFNSLSKVTEETMDTLVAFVGVRFGEPTEGGALATPESATGSGHQ